MRYGLRSIPVLLLLSLPPLGRSQEAKPTPADVLPLLRELKPLQKIHYSWPVPFKKLSDDLLFEYVRISHAVSLSGEWHNRDEADRAVKACKRVNEGKPRIPASIGINYSVWHRRFGKKLPPTDTGKTHQAELDHLNNRMELLRREIQEANRRHETRILVTCILFDSERFHIRPDDPEWNRAIDAKYDAAYEIVRGLFPEARIEWYGRGGIHPGATETGWAKGGGWFTLKEKGETFGCSLYRVPEIGVTRETYRRTVENAARHGCEEVTPWIALASGYRRAVHAYHEWSSDWDYDLIYSWKLGQEINQPWFSQPVRHGRFAPWNRAKIAIFYPAPFGQAPQWPKHFIAYVRGAHMIKSLPEK